MVIRFLLTILIFILTSCTNTAIIDITTKQDYQPDKHIRIVIRTGLPIPSGTFHEPKEYKVIYQ